MHDLRRRLAEIDDLERISMLLGWDQEVSMPPAAAEQRAEQRATVGRLAHELFTDDRTGELLASASPADEIEVDLLRVARRDFDRAVRVPAELVADRARAASDGRRLWGEARAGAGFARLAPALERHIELARRFADCFPESAHPYDALLDIYEPDMATTEVRHVLGRLRDGLVPLVGAAGGVDDSVLRDGPFAIAGQRRLVDDVLHAVGVEPGSWRLDLVEHPFQATIGAADIRVTTRYHERELESLFSSLHEFGHGLYERQIDPALARTPLQTGASSSWHESQSRLWENMIGRSGAFWRWCRPLAAAALPERFAEVTWQQIAAAANVVRPTLIRVSADEVTYGLHIVLRFELELELIEGTLAVGDLAEAWNERMRAMLGVEVPDDLRGVLQDVHWSEGLFGYFPTYALGNVIAGQLWARIQRELPELEEHVERGDFAPLREWLALNVHRFGRRQTPAELLATTFGTGLDPEPYLAYLAAKMRASASLMS
jgi:carboxypeptidase Taq